MSNEEIREKIKDDYYKLYDKYGVAPNRLLVSRDIYLQMLRMAETVFNQITREQNISMFEDLKIIVVDGKERIETAILYGG